MADYSGFKIKRPHSLAPLTSVYEAVAADGRPGRFALKIFHPPASTNIRRFYAIEGWLLAAERQQGSAKKDGTVLEVLAFGRCDEGAFAVMPWQDRPLDPFIKTLGAKGDTLRALAECLLNTIERWETQTGGPHGNLKPSNIFLDRSGPLAGMSAQLSDPAFMPGAKNEALRLADLNAVGTMLATIVRRRLPGAWPIEEAPEWKALGHPGKGWLAFCNYLLNPSAKEGELTIAEARLHLRKIPKDSNPVRTAVLTGAGVVLFGLACVAAFARFGNPIYMPDQIERLAIKLGNPRAFRLEVPPQWADLCTAWDTWLIDLQSNGDRLLRTEGLWEPNDPLRVALTEFVASANELHPSTLVPEAANEKRLGVLGKSPPPEVYSELLTDRVARRVEDAGARITTLTTRLERWPRWDELRSLLAKINERGFTAAAEALAPKLPPMPGSEGYRLDVVRTLRLFNDISLDETGTLVLASRWSEFSRHSTDMEASGDRVQKAMPRIIMNRLVDRASIGDFADSLTNPVDEVRLRRKQYLDPAVVRERFLKESPLQAETAEVTEEDFPRWEQELVMFSIVPAADDPRLAAELDASVTRLPQAAADLDPEAPAAEPGGLPTLGQADFAREFSGLTTALKSLRDRQIVRRDLPAIGEETTKMTGAFRVLEQQLEATLALLRPDVWLARVQKVVGTFNATQQRWAAWQQAALTGVTEAVLAADRNRFRLLRGQERQVRNWISGLEGPAGFAALTQPDLGATSADTAGELRRMEAVRREQAATAVVAAAEWRNNALPAVEWAAVNPRVRAPLEAHREWLAVLPEFAANLDRLSGLLQAGFGWTEGVSEVMDRLARFAGVSDLTGRPAEWTAESRQLERLVDNSDRAVLTAAAQSGGLSRKLIAWRRLGSIAGWPAGPVDFDLDVGVMTKMRELIGRDVKDEARRTSLGEEMVKETRLRFNRAARSASRDETQLTAMYERMPKAGLTDGELDEPVAYNLALWRLKRSDWNESNLDRLRVRRDNFVTTVRAIRGVSDQPEVSGMLDTLTGIELKDDPNRPPTKSPALVGWQEELTNEGLAMKAKWKSGDKSVELEYIIVQPEDGSPAFYLAKREVAVGEFVDLLATRPRQAGAVREALPKWATDTASLDKPWNKPMSWRPRSDGKGVEVNPNWIYLGDAQVKSLLDNKELQASTPALARAVSENPSARTPLQQVPPDGARIFAEQMLGARLPTPAEWRAVTALVGKSTDGFFRGAGFQSLWRFLDEYREGGQVVRWRPNEGIFLPLVSVPGTAGRRKFADDGAVVTGTDRGKLWLAPVDEGPVTGGFINLYGNVWVYLYDDVKKEYYVAGGSALSPPGIDIVEPYKVEASGMVGATKVREGFTDVGIRPAFDAPPGFRERYKLLVLVRNQKYLTL